MYEHRGPGLRQVRRERTAVKTEFQIKQARKPKARSTYTSSWQKGQDRLLLWFRRHIWDVIKGRGLIVFHLLSTNCNFKHIHDPNQIFAMMLYKSIVSLIAAFATTSCVSATPLLRRGDSPSSSTSQCNTGTQQCCDSVTSSDDPSTQLLAAFLGVNLNSVKGLVGLDCSVLSSSSW
jgi:hypothetical protein